MSSEFEAEMLRRNQAMADNIDALLKGCDLVQNKTQSDPIKCFFAVGIAHVLKPYLLKSIPEMLQEKGWMLEFLPPKKATSSYTYCL